MNSIIMKKHLSENRHDLVPTNLIVLFNKRKKPVPKFGLYPVKRDFEIIVEDGVKKVMKGQNFFENFKQHCEKTLQNKKNVVFSLQYLKA
jgi:hypothetical protein